MGPFVKALVKHANYYSEVQLLPGLSFPPNFGADSLLLPDITSMRGHCLKKQKLEILIQEGKACGNI